MKRFVVGNARALALVLLGALIGILLLNPVGAHVGNTINHLWNSPGHIQTKAKQLFFTKDVSDSRYQSDWAQVEADGTVVDQSGGIEVDAGQAGVYFVGFPTSQIPRALSVTHVFDEGSAFVSAGVCGEGLISCGPKHSEPRWVTVFITDETGTPASRTFYIVSTP